MSRQIEHIAGSSREKIGKHGFYDRILLWPQEVKEQDTNVTSKQRIGSNTHHTLLQNQRRLRLPEMKRDAKL